jgi:hypothetical protein
MKLMQRIFKNPDPASQETLLYYSDKSADTF